MGIALTRSARPSFHGIVAVFGTLTLLVALSACASDHAPPEPERSNGSSPSASIDGSVTPSSTDAAPSGDGPTTAPELPVESGQLFEEVELSTGVAIDISSIRVIDVVPETPGEVEGPAIVVTLSVKNDTEETQSVASAVVTVVTADGELGIPTTAGPNRPLTGELAPGARTSASYVYMLDPAQGREITVSVNYAAGEPIAEFSGQVP